MNSNTEGGDDDPLNQEMGVVAQPENAYRRLKNSQIKQLNRSEIRQHWQDKINYELTPLALKETKKALKNKKLDERAKYPYIKMVVDKAIADDQVAPQPSIVHIESLQMYVDKVLAK